VCSSDLRAEQILCYLANLPAEEKKIVHLRFEKGFTAGEISNEVGLSDPRKVFTIIDRIIRQLRAKSASVSGHENLSIRNTIVSIVPNEANSKWAVKREAN